MIDYFSGMRKSVTLFLLLFLYSSLQAAYKISGVVIDAGTGVPVDFVNATVSMSDSEVPIMGIATDENGYFEFSSVQNGKYTLRLSFVGYIPYQRNFTVNGKDVSFGTIKIEEDSKMLSEIEVVALGSQMKFEIDRKVFSVDQNIAAAGGSATEVLENIPSVEVDNEGNISLRNNESVEVWINGKPSGLTADNRAQILEQMPAESIESIEVITNPSAKFDPEGTAGIINLVLKKDRKGGYYGSVSGGLMYPQGSRLGGNVGANINYNSSKIDAYANIGYRNMGRKGGSLTDLTTINDNDTTLLHQNNENTSSHNGLFFRAGADYHINDKNTIGLSGFGMFGGGSGNSFLNYELNNLTTNDVERIYRKNNTNESSRRSFNINLDYKHEFDRKGTELLASLSYSRHTSQGENIYHQIDSFPSSEQSKTGQTSKNSNSGLQFKVDYTNKLTETGRLEVGWQSNIQNRFDESDGLDLLNGGVQLPQYYNVFDYKEQIHALYVTYGERFFEKFSAQVGLRGEYMLKNAVSQDINLTEMKDDKSYFQLFPSVYLGYSISDRDEIQLNYTRRVNRPRGWQINPFRDYSDSTNISFGNQALSPEFSSAFELNYMRNWDYHSLSASAFYRFTDDVIQRVRYKVPTGTESTFMNITQSNYAGLELVAKNSLFKILNLTSSVNLYYSKIDAATYHNPYNDIEEIIKQQSGFAWNARIMANVMIARDFTGQITGRYTSPRVIAQGRQESDYSIDLGLRKSFFNRTLNVNLTVRDLLNSRRRKSSTSGTGFSQYSESYWSGRSVGINLTYNFGNMNPKKNERRSDASGISGDMEMGGEM